MLFPKDKVESLSTPQSDLSAAKIIKDFENPSISVENGLGDCHYIQDVLPKRAFSIQYSVFFAILTLFMVINCK